MQALILAGGKGSRLKSITENLPKPLLLLGDISVIEILIQRFRQLGITEIVIAIGHLGNMIQDHFSDGQRFGVRIQYTVEKEPLGTAGPIRAVLNAMHQDFFVVNGDILTSINFLSLLEKHEQSHSAITVSVIEKKEKIEFGVIETDSNMEFKNFLEKPIQKYWINMGIYMLKRDAVRSFFAETSHLDMPDLILRLHASGAKVSCHNPDCYWIDIGDADNFYQAQQKFIESRHLFLDINQ